MKIKKLILAGVMMMVSATGAAWATDSNPITITAIVATVNDISLTSGGTASFGTVALDPARTFIPGTAAGTTSTPNAVAFANDPWQVTGSVKVTMTFKNNLPGDLLIYTNHSAQGYFADVDTNQLVSTTNISGLIHVGDNTPLNTRKDSLLTHPNAYLTTVPIRAWVAMNNEAVVTTNASAPWVWITDASPAFNDNRNDLARITAGKQKLIDYSLVSKDTMDVYIRGAFSWPKFPGTYIATVIIEFVRQ